MRTFIDLFAGIGGFHLAAAESGLECVFACEKDAKAAAQYERAFGMKPASDVCEVERFPAHDLLLGGFPCQAFSIAGHRRGAEDARGTLFMEIARALEQAKPAAFVLENVKGLTTMPEFQIILRTLRRAGYKVRWRVYNALDFGLPQHRERVWIVGRRDGRGFEWPVPPRTPWSLADVLEDGCDAVLDPMLHRGWFAGGALKGDWKVKNHSPALLVGNNPPLVAHVVHTNMGGHRKANPFAVALRADASANYQMVNGVRRFTPREMLRLQGFPDEYPVLTDHYQTIRRQTGNALPVPVAAAVVKAVVEGAERMPAETPDMFGEAA